MSATYRTLTFIGVLFFVLGLGYGVWSNRPANTESGPMLMVLCPKSWLPPAVTEEIAQRLKTRAVQLDFDSWSEFVRLAANTQGKADVICLHSFLAKDLIQSKFLEPAKLSRLPSFRNISVDFNNLPFDPEFEYTAPLFWGVNGFVVHADATPTTWQKLWPSQGGKMALLFPDLELLWRMRISGLEMHDEDDDGNSRKLTSFVQTFFKSLSDISPNRPQFSDEDLKRFQFIQLSSGVAAEFLKDHPDWKYWVPDDGVSLWLGLVGIGSQSRYKSLALQFVDELLKPEHAITLHKALQHGVVHSSLDTDDSILPMQKSRYLHEIPLDRVRFPDLTLEILPRWEHVVSEARQ